MAERQESLQTAPVELKRIADTLNLDLATKQQAGEYYNRTVDRRELQVFAALHSRSPRTNKLSLELPSS